MSNLRRYSNPSVENKQLHNKCDDLEQHGRNSLLCFSVLPHNIGKYITNAVAIII